MQMNKNVIYYPRKAVENAVEEFETPFFLYEEKRIRENCARFRDAFKTHFPDSQMLYAVKANSNPEVLKIVIDEGYLFDASSRSEAWIGDKLGVGGMYTANYTTAETLKYSMNKGFMLNLDDISNVPMLFEIGVPEFISFRINPGVGDAVEESCVLAGPDSKYGMPFEKASEAYAAAAKLGVKRFGIHMMTGSNVPIDKKDYFSEIVEKLLEVIAEVKKETGVEIETMNIGGGFGVPYEPEKEGLDIEKVAKGIREVMDKKCKELDIKEPQLMVEPGRYIAADAGWLVGKVTVIKESYKKFVGINAASNDMPRPSIYGAYHYISVLSDASEEMVSVVGDICENNDQFAKDRMLAQAQIGDTVVIHNCGAHAFAMGHNYNGKIRHAEYMLRMDGELEKIREEETIEDLYRGCKL